MNLLPLVAGVGIIKRTSFKILFSVCLSNRHLVVFEPLEKVLVQSLQWPCRTPLIIGNLLVLKQQTNLHIYIFLQLQSLLDKNISSLLESHKVDPAIFSGLSLKHSVHHTLFFFSSQLKPSPTSWERLDGWVACLIV